LVKIKLLKQGILKTETDLIVVSLFKDIIPLKGTAGYVDWMYNGKISDLIAKKKVFGLFKETVLFSTQNKIPAEKILFLGFGKAAKMEPTKLLYLYSNLVKILRRIDIYQFGIGVDIPYSIDINEYRRMSNNMIEGLIQGFKKIELRHSEYTVKIAEEDDERFNELRKVLRLAFNNLKATPEFILEN